MNAGNIADAFVSSSKWNSVPAKRLFTNSKEINQGMKECNRLALTMKGVINRSLDDLQGLQSSDYSVYQIFEKDDLVFKLIDLENIKTSRVGIVHERGIMSPAYIRVSAKTNSIYPRFYYWYFFALYVNNIYNKLGGGVRQNLTVGDLLEIPVPLIDFSLQKQVSTFLDRETQRIDSLIEEKQNFIKLLKEKRQALISHVVTKGLNPNVEMQDSGIEWIGQVPKHWGISKVRYLGQCQNGINIGGEFFGHGTPFVSYGDVYNNTSLPEQVQGLVLSTEKDRDNYSVIAGDVLFTRTSETIEEIGFSAVCKSTIEQAVFAGFLIRFRPDEGNLEVGFSEYYFRNEKLRAFFAKEMNLVTRASLSQDLLKKMPVLLPPIDEQNEIANYLQAECNKFSEIFAETEKTILLLKERRTSLISAAVTGKIDVREAV